MLALLLLLSACATYDAMVDLQFCEQEPPPPQLTDTPLEYHRDIAPIIEARCATCHDEGGIGPFPLTTYDEVEVFHQAVRASVESGRMPPWPADDCCGQEYLHSRRMPDSERTALLSWLDQGRVEGDPNAEPSIEIEVPDYALSRVDATVQMAAPYEPKALVGDSDELRCFLLDYPEDAGGSFVTGLNFIPGERRVVHHVIIAAVEPGAGLDDYEARDAADPEEGFDCYDGTFRRGVSSLGGWVPGAEASDFPAGWGSQLPEGGKILLQMHYDIGSVPEGTTDQSTIELKLDETLGPDVEAATFLVANPMWLFDNGMKLPGDFEETTYRFHWDPQYVYGEGRSWNLHKIFLHMHEYGTSGRVAVLREDGTQECLLNIDDWDFYWHGDYWLQDPVRLEPGDRLYVECTFVNPTSRAIRWGADQEMCGALISAVEVP